MAKRKKNNQIGARVDDAFRDKVDAYTEAAHMSQGDLVRVAVDEFMAAHPLTMQFSKVTNDPNTVNELETTHE